MEIQTKTEREYTRDIGRVTALFKKYGFFDRAHKVKYEIVWKEFGGPSTRYEDLMILINTLNSPIENPAGLYLPEYNKREAKKILLNYLESYEKRNINKNPKEAKKAQKIKSELLKILGE